MKKTGFIERVNHHQGIIHRVCLMYCADSEDRNDLFQEILYQLWKSYPSYNPVYAFSTWMYKVAINTAITHLRKTSKHFIFQPIRKRHEAIPDILPGSSPDEDIREMYAAIERLTNVEKAIILLYLDEKSYQEIATVLDISVTNVGAKINRIKKKLAKLISPY